MTQNTSGLYKVLSSATVYSLFQNLVGANRLRKCFVEQHVLAQSGDRVLDIGCGTGAILALLAEVDYTGYDPSAAYIHKAREMYFDRGVFFVGEVGSTSMAMSGRFDIVLAMGVLHHLDDDQALQLFCTAHEVLAPGGRLISIDPVFAPGQHPLAKWMIRRDRGKNVRTESELLRIAARQFSETKAMLRSDLLRIPYTHIVLECLRNA